MLASTDAAIHVIAAVQLVNAAGQMEHADDGEH